MDFLEISKGLEKVPEGGERCFKCYKLRLEETARLAKAKDFDYFCTTLSISPLKNSQKINEIGFEIAEKYGVKWLPSDFKRKKDISVQSSFQSSIICIARTSAACVFSKRRKYYMNHNPLASRIRPSELFRGCRS